VGVKLIFAKVSYSFFYFMVVVAHCFYLFLSLLLFCSESGDDNDDEDDEDYNPNEDDDNFIVIDEDAEDKEETASAPAPAPAPAAKTYPQPFRRPTRLPPAQSRDQQPEAPPTAVIDVDRGDLIEGLASLSTGDESAASTIMHWYCYLWTEGENPEVMDAHFNRTVHSQQERITVDMLLFGPTTHDQLRAHIIEDGMAVRVLYRPPPVFLMSNRIAEDIPGFESDPDAAVVASRVVGHHAAINQIVNKHSGEVEWEIIIPLPVKCEQQFTDRNDYGVARSAKPISIGVYRHGDPLFEGNADIGPQYAFFLHCQLKVVQKNPLGTVMSPQRFTYGRGTRSGGGGGGPPPLPGPGMAPYHPSGGDGGGGGGWHQGPTFPPGAPPPIYHPAPAAPGYYAPPQF
jgi:hypothetical protein